jgi:hypothetical protein
MEISQIPTPTLTWADFDPNIPIGYYWEHADLSSNNPTTDTQPFPLYVIPFTKRTIKVNVTLHERIKEIKEKIRVELERDGQYVPASHDFCLVPQVLYLICVFLVCTFHHPTEYY